MLGTAICRRRSPDSRRIRSACRSLDTGTSSRSGAASPTCGHSDDLSPGHAAGEGHRSDHLHLQIPSTSRPSLLAHALTLPLYLNKTDELRGLDESSGAMG